MNDQFKTELQTLLAKYPEVQSVIVKMVQSFEITSATTKTSVFPPSPLSSVSAPVPKVDLKPEIAAAVDQTLAVLNSAAPFPSFKPQ
jgi:hypothetical protein